MLNIVLSFYSSLALATPLEGNVISYNQVQLLEEWIDLLPVIQSAVAERPKINQTCSRFDYAVHELEEIPDSLALCFQA